MRFDIMCCTCGEVKLGEVVFDETVTEEEGNRRARDMGRCGACQEALEAAQQVQEQAVGDEPV